MLVRGEAAEQGQRNRSAKNIHNSTRTYRVHGDRHMFSEIKFYPDQASRPVYLLFSVDGQTILNRLNVVVFQLADQISKSKKNPPVYYKMDIFLINCGVRGKLLVCILKYSSYTQYLGRDQSKWEIIVSHACTL